jgi:hypothetical protein
VKKKINYKELKAISDQLFKHHLLAQTSAKKLKEFMFAFKIISI